MKVIRQRKGYEWLTEYALEVLEEAGLSHDSLYLVYSPLDKLSANAIFSATNSVWAFKGKLPTITIFYNNIERNGREADIKFIVSHEIGHYRDWVAGTLVYPLEDWGERTRTEQSANDFAAIRTGYTPHWVYGG